MSHLWFWSLETDIIRKWWKNIYKNDLYIIVNSDIQRGTRTLPSFNKTYSCPISLHFVILMLVKNLHLQNVFNSTQWKGLKHSMNMLWSICWAPAPAFGSPEGRLACPVYDGRGCEAQHEVYTTGHLGNSTHTLHSGAQKLWDFLIAFSTFLDLGPCLLEHRKYLCLSTDG